MVIYNDVIKWCTTLFCATLKNKKNTERFIKLLKFEEFPTIKKEPDSIQCIRNLFQLGKRNNKIKDQVLDDARYLFKVKKILQKAYRNKRIIW